MIALGDRALSMPYDVFPRFGVRGRGHYYRPGLDAGSALRTSRSLIFSPETRVMYNKSLLQIASVAGEASTTAEFDLDTV